MLAETYAETSAETFPPSTPSPLTKSGPGLDQALGGGLVATKSGPAAAALQNAGSRANGINPRAMGTNPRALGENPRAVAKSKWALRTWKRKNRTTRETGK